MKIRIFFNITAICTLLFVLPASALTIFGSKEDAIKDRFAAANKLMAKADEAFNGGNVEHASKYYERAIEKFEAVNKADPNFLDGLAALRIQYCAERYTNTLEAINADISNGKEATAAEIETGTGPEKIAGEATGTDPENSSGNVGTDPEITSGKTGTGLEKTTEIAGTDPEKSALEEEVSVAPPYNEKNLVHDFNEARIQLEDGNLSEAAAILIPILRHDPSNRQVRLLLAIVRTRQGRYDEAIVSLEDLRGRRNDLPILLALSGAYMSAGRYHDAMLALDDATRVNPNDPAPYMNLAWLTLVMPGNDPDTLKNAESYYRLAIKRGATRDRVLEKRIGLEKW